MITNKFYYFRKNNFEKLEMLKLTLTSSLIKLFKLINKC